MTPIKVACTDDEVRSCFCVMQQLRTNLVEEEFLQRVRLQASSGYELALLESEGHVCAVAGFRLIENLFTGRVLYVDDLVTDKAYRSRGHGRTLLDWLVTRARGTGCKTLELDSGVQRAEAHRFYLGSGMVISSHHFRLEI